MTISKISDIKSDIQSFMKNPEALDYNVRKLTKGVYNVQFEQYGHPVYTVREGYEVIIDFTSAHEGEEYTHTARYFTEQKPTESELKEGVS